MHVLDPNGRSARTRRGASKAGMLHEKSNEKVRRPSICEKVHQSGLFNCVRPTRTLEMYQIMPRAVHVPFGSPSCVFPASCANGI